LPLCDAVPPWPPRSSPLPSSRWVPWVNYGWPSLFGHYFPAAILCSFLYQAMFLADVVYAYSFYPQASDAGETHGMVSITAVIPGHHI
jgi:hypothetical protein